MRALPHENGASARQIAMEPPAHHAEGTVDSNDSGGRIQITPLCTGRVNSRSFTRNYRTAARWAFSVDMSIT
jgi:hypothetical protein